MKIYLPDRATFSIDTIEKLSATHRLAEEPHEADVLLVRVGTRVDRELLNRMSTLRLVASATTGLDHIDREACERRSVDVVSLKGETAFLNDLPNTSEHAFALLLALWRRLFVARDDVHAGSWRQSPFRGRTLAGKRFGIVGHGRLGRIAARIATGFGMQVLFFDPEPVCEPDAGVRRLESLTALAQAVDVLSLHADLNDGNERLIDAAIFDRMGSQSVLVNTARGQLVDEDALLLALRSRRIAGAALDVVWNEDEFGPGNALLEYARCQDNLILTPHIGGQTEEAVAMADRYILKKIDQWCKLYDS